MVLRRRRARADVPDEASESAAWQSEPVPDALVGSAWRPLRSNIRPSHSSRLSLLALFRSASVRARQRFGRRGQAEGLHLVEGGVVSIFFLHRTVSSRMLACWGVGFAGSMIPIKSRAWHAVDGE